jgi:hypothetical protein
VQEWHGARETSLENFQTGKMFNKKPRKHERRRRDAGRALNAKREKTT